MCRGAARQGHCVGHWIVSALSRCRYIGCALIGTGSAWLPLQRPSSFWRQDVDRCAGTGPAGCLCVCSRPSRAQFYLLFGARSSAGGPSCRRICRSPSPAAATADLVPDGSPRGRRRRQWIEQCGRLFVTRCIRVESDSREMPNMCVNRGRCCARPGVHGSREKKGDVSPAVSPHFRHASRHVRKGEKMLCLSITLRTDGSVPQAQLRREIERGQVVLKDSTVFVFYGVLIIGL